jgi:hypothetical protein
MVDRVIRKLWWQNRIRKCFYYLLSWKLDKNGDPEPELIKDRTTNNNREKIYLTTNDYEKVHLEQRRFIQVI